jgi:hypothetical protein
MSRTHKIQRAYIAHHSEFDDYSQGTSKHQDVKSAFRDTGQRYGDQRKMRAKLKVSERRIDKKKSKRAALKQARETESE